uniref:Uncharacterized protein n=1 Tax=Arundo donax TaxID=35708 RepID=A0A0A9F622_ARUDO
MVHTCFCLFMNHNLITSILSFCLTALIPKYNLSFTKLIL